MPLDYETPPKFDREPPQWWVLACALVIGIGVLIVWFVIVLSWFALAT